MYAKRARAHQQRIQRLVTWLPVYSHCTIQWVSNSNHKEPGVCDTSSIQSNSRTACKQPSPQTYFGNVPIVHVTYYGYVHRDHSECSRAWFSLFLNIRVSAHLQERISTQRQNKKYQWRCRLQIILPLQPLVLQAQLRPWQVSLPFLGSSSGAQPSSPFSLWRAIPESDRSADSMCSRSQQFIPQSVG